MWKQMARIIGEVRPQYAFVENSPMLTSRGLGTVLGDLAEMGFDAEWGVLSAADVGANHLRERIWIVGKNTQQHKLFSHTNHGQRWGQQQLQSIEKTNANVANPSEIREQWECSIQTDGCSGSIIRQNNAKNAKKSTKMGRVQNMANTSLSGLTPCNNTPLGLKKQLLEKQLGRGGNEFGTTKHWWEAEPNVGRVVDGMANRVDRLKAIGNGQVPLCAATAWRILSERLQSA
jgi:DNA (cytosine-5)-methyltransferase 1